MKKFTAFLFVFILMQFSAYAENPLHVRFMTKGIYVISPDGIKMKYDSIDGIPDILYSSKIIAYGMAILNYHGVDIILKNGQGIYAAKDPIGQELIISKVENSFNGSIHIKFDEFTYGELYPESKISLKYENSAIISKVLLGNVLMESEGEIFELCGDETFKFILQEQGEQDAI